MLHPCFIHVSSTSLMSGPEDDWRHLQSWWAHCLDVFLWFGLQIYKPTFKFSKKPIQIYETWNPWKLGTNHRIKNNWHSLFPSKLGGKKMTKGLDFGCRLFFQICHWHLGTFGSLVASAVFALIQRRTRTKRNILVPPVILRILRS